MFGSIIVFLCVGGGWMKGRSGSDAARRAGAGMERGGGRFSISMLTLSVPHLSRNSEHKFVSILIFARGKAKGSAAKEYYICNN